MLAACARGLDLIDVHLGTLGATELRAQATAQGDELARLAMAHAVRTGDAGRLLAWSERWRATSLAVPPVRRAVDPEMTRDLAALRVLARRLEDEPRRPRLRRSCATGDVSRRPYAGGRCTAWLPGPAPGPGRSGSPSCATCSAARTWWSSPRWTGSCSRSCCPRTARSRCTTSANSMPRSGLWSMRCSPCAGRAPTGAGRRSTSARSGSRLEQALLGPVVDTLAASSVVVVPTGRLHAVPWALLPGLKGRALTVAPSAAYWMRGQRSVTTGNGTGRPGRRTAPVHRRDRGPPAR